MKAFIKRSTLVGVQKQEQVLAADYADLRRFQKRRAMKRGRESGSLRREIHGTKEKRKDAKCLTRRHEATKVRAGTATSVFLDIKDKRPKFRPEKKSDLRRSAQERESRMGPLDRCQRRSQLFQFFIAFLRAFVSSCDSCSSSAVTGHVCTMQGPMGGKSANWTLPSMLVLSDEYHPLTRTARRRRS